MRTKSFKSAMSSMMMVPSAIYNRMLNKIDGLEKSKLMDINDENLPEGNYGKENLIHNEIENSENVLDSNEKEINDTLPSVESVETQGDTAKVENTNNQTDLHPISQTKPVDQNVSNSITKRNTSNHAQKKSVEVKTESESAEDFSNQSQTYTPVVKMGNKNEKKNNSRKVMSNQKIKTKYYCNLCDKYYARKFTLDRHTKTKHMEKSKVTKPPEKITENKRKSLKRKIDDVNQDLPKILKREGLRRKSDNDRPPMNEKILRLQQGEKRKYIDKDNSKTKKRRYTTWLNE